MTQLAHSFSSHWKIATIPDSKNEISIRYGLFQKGQGPINRCVVFLNGRTEWIEKNAEIPEWLDLPPDCGFLTFDHRGQGGTGGDKSFIRSYEQYVDDASHVINTVLGKRIPYVILSHSMGGLIALYANMAGKIHPHSMVLSAPLLMISNQPFPAKVSFVLSKTLSALGFGKVGSGAGQYDKKRFEKNRLTRNHDMYLRIKNSPFPVGSATFGWVSATFDAFAYVYNPENIKRLSAPILILSAGEEKVVDSDSHKRWLNLASQYAKVRLSIEKVQGSRHEIFSETPEVRNLGIAKARNWFKDFLK
jgi:lysophospholipase